MPAPRSPAGQPIGLRAVAGCPGGGNRYRGPQAELADEPRALDLLLDARTGELGPELGVERVLAGLLELVEGARLTELLCEFGRGLSGSERLLQEPNLLVGRDRAVVLPPRFRREPQDRFRRAELGPPKALLRNGGTLGKRCKIEEPNQDLAFDLQFEAAGEA